MKRLLISLSFLVFAGSANADMASYNSDMPRYDTSGMTCDEVHAALQSSGKAILQWHSSTGMPRWGKYMAAPSGCKMQQIPGHARVPTSDTKSCVVNTCINYGRSVNRM